jgi:predicted alpha/beta hydrolase family esterase
LGAASWANWFPWLKKELVAQGFDAVVPDFPHSLLPSMNAWVQSLAQLEPDENTVLIGHSLGGVLILRFLEAYDVRVGSVFLAATPVNDLGWPQLKKSGFFKEPFDFKTIRSRARNFLIMSDAEDPFVALSHGDVLANELNCKHSVLHQGDHFMTLTFPELLELILLRG